MSEHKNKNEAKGNFGIYQITIFGKVFKFGKADLDRVTQISGEPTRIHQQKRKYEQANGNGSTNHKIVLNMPNSSTKIAKDAEKSILESYVEQTGEVPEGNKKSFKPKQK